MPSFFCAFVCVGELVSIGKDIFAKHPEGVSISV